MSHQWDYLPDVILRTTGFPLEILDGLRMAEDPAGSGAVMTEAEFTPLLDEQRRNLYRIVRSPRISEAIFLCSPDMEQRIREAKEIAGANRNNKFKRFERRLTAYVQRLATKNDTTSFFGPINYGRLSTDEPAHMRIAFRPNGSFGGRRAMLGYWAAKALMGAIGRDPEVRLHLVPRLSPLVTRTATGVIAHAPREKEINLPPVALRILDTVDGTRTLAEVSGAMGAANEPQVLAAVMKLVEYGVLQLPFEPPPSTADHVEWMLAEMARFPSGPSRGWWLSGLRLLAERLEQFAAAGLDERRELFEKVRSQVEEMTGVGGSEAGSGFYTDRHIVFEDVLGDVAELTLGAPFLDNLNRYLDPILTLSAVQAQLVREAWRAWAVQLLSEAFPEHNAVSLPRAFSVLEHKGETFDLAAYGPLNAFHRDFRALLEARREGSRIQVEPDDLALLVQRYPMPGWAFASPDIMLAAPDPAAVARGEYQIVIGEVHGGAQIWSCLLIFYSPEERVRLAEEFRQRLAEIEPTPAEITASRRIGGRYLLELPMLTIEYDSPSEHPKEHVLPASDIEVRWRGGELELWSRSRATRLELVRSSQGGPTAESLAVDVTKQTVSLGRHTPRILVGPVVYQRERWDLPAAEVLAGLPDQGTQPDLLTKAAQLRERYGWPERVFVKTEREGKPIIVDFRSYLSVELFVTVLREAESLSVTEMLPEPGDCWLRRSDGHYTSEIRLTAMYRGPARCEGGDH